MGSHFPNIEVFNDTTVYSLQKLLTCFLKKKGHFARLGKSNIKGPLMEYDSDIKGDYKLKLVINMA